MPADQLRSLLSWFPSGTAEGERAILDKVFVYVDEFRTIMSPPSGNPYLLIGNKGTGKSAIVDFATRLLGTESVPVIVLQPSDIDTSGITDDYSMGDMVRVFYGVLISAIAGKLAENMSGLLTGDQATIYNEAVRSGDRSPGLLGRLARSLGAIAHPVTNLDVNKIFPELNSSTKKELEAAVANQVSDRRFYIFIDDTDQVANPGRAGHLNRIWGLILAVRELASKVPEIRAVITLRTEVWDRLRRESSGQRDQTDHFTNLSVVLSSSKKKIIEIVERRLSLAATEVKSDKDGWLTFFEGVGARAPYSIEHKSWADLIAVRARGRPRDAIQLVGLLAKRGLTEKHSRIDEEDFRGVMPTFSEERAALFAREVETECPQAFEIIRSFATLAPAEGGFRFSAEEMRGAIKRAATKFGIVLRGISIRPEVEADVLDLWRFLYASDVLNARVSDTMQKDGYRHIEVSSDPMLVSKARWNDMQKALWEINPAYRDFLIHHQEEEARTSGIPTKPRPRRARPRR